MAAFFGTEVILIVLLSTLSASYAAFGVAKPFPPEDNYPVELESLEITCIAFDPAGKVVPQKIEFIRTDRNSTEHVLMENGRIEFTNRSVVIGNGTKLFVTLHIRNITVADDSHKGLGQYKCKAYGVEGNSTVDALRRFRVNVFRRHEIPRLAVPSEFVLQRGQKAVIKCNLTYRGSGTPILTKLSWFNGDKLLKTQENPKAEELPTVVIHNPDIEDVGNYTCVLGLMLRRLVAYNVTAETAVKIAPWLEKNEGSKVVNQGQSVALECSARGVPLSVEWKIQRNIDETVKTISGCLNSSSPDSRYKISPGGSNGQSVMSIKNVKIADTGNYYYCCLPSNCSNIIDQHQCQKFTLLLAEFGIVKPFPPYHNYPVELESLEITCIAFDPTGKVVPQKIEFIRTDRYSTEHVLMENGRIEFTNRSVVIGNGTKLFVTLHIRNITEADDSQKGLGQYKCKAYGVEGNSTVDVLRRFSVNVFRRHEVPRLAAPSEFVLQRGQKAVIKCNLTYRGSGTPILTKLSWFNGDKLLKTQENPNAEALPTVVIQNPDIEDVGNYTCVLGVMLRRLIAYNVTAETTVKIAPWLEENEGSKVVNQGQSVTLECSARGVPLSVEWKIQRKIDETVKTISGCFNSSSPDSRYKISPRGSNGQSVMFIKDVKIADTGNYYYCCLPSNCSNIIDQHRCQKFALLLGSAGMKTKASLSVVLGVVAFLALRLHF